jgi:hypothetical protein
MGGLGSGKWYRWDRRTTLAELGRLDVRRLQRDGFLDGQDHWTIVRQGRGWLMLAVTCQEGTLAVEPWCRDRLEIALDWTRCHYGGMRPWMRCPRCDRRLAVLSVVGTRVLCRHCVRLPYASQCATAEDRCYQQVWKLRERLGASRDLTAPIRPSMKPKGMHKRTWERLWEQEQYLQERLFATYTLHLAALMRHEAA